MEMSWTDIDSEELHPPPVTARDIMSSIKSAKPSVGPEYLDKCQKWARMYEKEGA